MEYDICPICLSPSHNIIELNPFSIQCDCLRCGIFKIDERALTKYKYLTSKNTNAIQRQIAIFTGWIRENQNVTLTERIIDDFYSFKLPTLEKRAKNLLKSFTDPYDLIGGRNTINFDNLERIINKIELNEHEEHHVRILAKDLKYMAVTWSYDIKELKYIYQDYLMGEKKYLEALDQNFCKITPKGWVYLESLRQANPESIKAFVAMWITDEMKGICENYIKPAAEDAGGYKAESIDEKDFNGDINDAIIGEIRNSKFVIADFTGNRGGVYYEAGFAYGFRIPVIYSCREDWFNKVVDKEVEAELKNKKNEIVKIKETRKIHFDINHSKFIRWENGDDLYKQLVQRIKATIP